jgi:hypothetical protein
MKGTVWMPPEYITVAGILLQTVLYLLGGYAVIIRNGEGNRVLREQIQGIQIELKSLAHVVTQMAVQDERLNNQGHRLNEMDKRIEALRRGDGFIAGSRGVEKEY